LNRPDQNTVRNGRSEKVILRHTAHNPARHTHNNATWRHVVCDNCASGDERLLTDLYTRHEHGTPADPAGTTQHGAAQLLPRRKPRHRVVIGANRPRPYEHVVLNHGTGRYIHHALDPYARADNYIAIHTGTAPEQRSSADPTTLTDISLIADNHSRTNFGSRKNNRLREN
jgi:hypothetical protein